MRRRATRKYARQGLVGHPDPHRYPSVVDFACVDIRKISHISTISRDYNKDTGSWSYTFTVHTSGGVLPLSFDDEEKAQKERMWLLETWYSIAAEDAMLSMIHRENTNA